MGLSNFKLQFKTYKCLIKDRGRHEERNKKGFTLLETCLSFILFAILLQSIWGFFSNIYIQFIRLEQQVSIISEAAAVTDFIRQEIRSADKVRIVTTLGTIIETNNSGSIDDVQVENESLKSIKYQVKVPRTNGLGYTQKVCEIILSPVIANPTKGAQKISYFVKSVDGVSVGTNNTVISELIEDIKITCYKDSNLVEFTCEVYKKNETNPKLKMIKKFTESLEYKERY